MIRVETVTGDVKVQRDTVDVVVQSPAMSVQVVREGPQGKPGVQGVPGPQGAPGDLTRPVADALYERRSGLLSEAVWHVDAGVLTDDGTALRDLSDNGRHAVFGAGAAAPVVLPWDGEDYLHIPAAAGNGVTITTGAALPYTATRRDGTTVTGTTPAGAWTFTTAGDWARIATDDGACILDPRNVNTDYTKIANTGTAGGDWTIQRAASGFKTTVVDRPLLLFGGGQVATAVNMPDFTSGGSTILLAMRRFGTPGVEGLVDHGYAGSNTAGVQLQISTNRSVVYFAKDGSGALTRATSALVDGQHVIGGLWTTDEISAIEGGKRYGPAPNPVRLPKGNAKTVSIGNWVSGSYPASFEFIAYAVFDRALTDAEVAKATQELLGTPHTEQPDPHPQYVLKSQNTRVSRPNGTDRLVEVWDGTAWVVVHYDSGIRRITHASNGGATVTGTPIGSDWEFAADGYIYVHRSIDTVTVWVENLRLKVSNSNVPLVVLPAGFLPFRAYGKLVFQASAGPLTLLVHTDGRVVRAGNTSMPAGYAAAHSSDSFAAPGSPIPTSLPGTLISTAP